MWDAFVDLIRAAITAVAQLFDGRVSGGGVLVSGGVRLHRATT